jgi:hypothetical protein
MPIVEQFKQMGYKTEGVELTAETLVAADYDTVWDECGVYPEDTYNERRPRRATFSAIQGVGGPAIGRVSGIFEPRPSGTDNTAPDWYQMLRASGASVTTDVATWGAESVATGILGAACTFVFRDGLYHRTASGTRLESMRFFAESGGVWKCEIAGVGRYAEAAATAYLAAAHPSAGQGQPFLGLTCNIMGQTTGIASAEIAIENVVSPVKDGSHASGFGRNIITGQKLMGRFKVEDLGSPDWRGLFRNDASGDVVAVSLVMATGTAGNVLTWTGNLHLVEQPEIVYEEGIGYRNLVGEFITTGASAALTLTQT